MRTIMDSECELAQSLVWFLHFQQGVYYGGSSEEKIIPLLHREKQNLSKIIHARSEQWGKKEIPSQSQIWQWD